MIFVETLKPRLSDIDYTGHVSYESILKILEDVGTHHSDAQGDKIISREDGDLAWILAEWHVEIIKRLDKREDITVESWISGKRDSLFFFRNFIIMTEDGDICVRAQTKLLLVDIKTMKPLRISGEIYDKFDPEENSAIEVLPRIKAAERYECTVPLYICNDDIDFNGHVHNTRYLGFALSALPYDVSKDMDISEIHFSCRQALKPEDQAEVRYIIKDGEAHFAITVNGKEYMLMDIKTRA